MNSNIYEEKYKIISEDACEFGMMKISAMFDRLHDVADESLKPVNLDRESLEKLDILWVLGEQSAEIIDLPRLDDIVTIKTWVGDNFFNFIPRFYQIEKDGEVLVKASSVWAIIDKSSREMLTPSKNNVYMEPIKTGNEIAILETPKKLDLSSNFEYVVSKDNLDFNNHMNNAQYIEIIDSYNHFVRNGGKVFPRKIIARYSKEAFLGDVLIMREGILNSSRFYTVDSNRGNHLKLRIEY